MPELLDLYDTNKQMTEIKISRGDTIPRDLYFRSVSVWIVNNRAEYLISKRHPNKKYGGYWECTGGVILSGENSLDGAVREVQEELGLRLNRKNGKLIYTTFREDRQDIYDVWVFNCGDNEPSLQLQEDEVVDAKWVTLKQLLTMYKNKKLHPLINYIDKLIHLGQ